MCSKETSFKKRSYMQSLFGFKCPRCRQSDLFTKPFKVSQPLDMPQHCSYCDLNYNPEPGYYWGAMFISYIISAFPLMGIVLFCMFGLHYSVVSSLVIGIGIAAIFYFPLMRFSRSLWIHLMKPYNPPQ